MITKIIAIVFLPVLLLCLYVSFAMLLAALMTIVKVIDNAIHPWKYDQYGRRIPRRPQ
jgi:hypothetical protein